MINGILRGHRPLSLPPPLGGHTTVTIHDGHLEDLIQWSHVKVLLAEPKLLQNMLLKAYSNGKNLKIYLIFHIW